MKIAFLVVMGTLLFVMAVFLPLCLAIVFKKAGRSPWNVLVSQWYISFVLGEIAGLDLSFLDCHNPIKVFRYYPQICLGIAENFGRGPHFGIGLAFLPPVFYAILAFNKNIKYKRPGVSNSTTPTSLRFIRKHYERKAAQFTQSDVLMEVKPKLPAEPRISKTASLPPLPPLLPEIDGSASQNCFVLAGELEAKGERENAIEQYTEAIRLNSRHTTAYFKRGILLMELNCKPAAIADFRRVVEFADNPELTDIAKGHITSLGK
jgi:tetratricopeptide (TPR) repeat protein